MNLPLTGIINHMGHLEIGGCDAVSLAKEYGTPLYVIDESDVRENCRAYKDLFRARYPGAEIIYASKALSTTGLLKIIHDEGLGVDVTSGGELFTALKAGFASKKIYFHGNNKSARELDEAIKASVGRIVADSFDEISMLDQMAKSAGRKVNVMIRVNPGVEAHTHQAIRTGQTDSKFGISKDRIEEAVKLVAGSKNLVFSGLHAHIGSQIFDAKGYLSEIDVLTQLAKNIHDRLKVGVEELNIGGGIGISYIDTDRPLGLESFADAITKRVKEKIAQYRIPEPRLALEPGRSIVGRAGVTLYSVGLIKDIPGTRKYVIVDGGMADNIRPMLYGAKYEFVIADNMNSKASEKVTIAGRFCESGDVLARDVKLGKVQKGSIIASLCTGAYNYSMASNYNRVPRPAMVLVRDGSATLIVKREGYEDITSCDII